MYESDIYIFLSTSVHMHAKAQITTVIHKPTQLSAFTLMMLQNKFIIDGEK